MPGMKVTVDSAMRARDVSRPRGEHEILAAAGEPRPARAREQSQGALAGDAAAPASGSASPGASPGAAGGAAKGRSSRRRRRRR